MCHVRRRILLFVSGTLAVVALASCASSHGETVVAVAGQPITKATVDHWMSALAAGPVTAPGQPKADVPQPPNYVACISYKKRYQPGNSGSTQAQLKTQCELEYQRLKLQALYTLITGDWVQGEATELNAKISGQELERRLASVKRQSFPGGMSFDEYLASTRLTEADFLLGLKLTLLTDKVQRTLEDQPAMQRLTFRQLGTAFEKFGREYVRKWTARTDCRAGYVVPICQQYKPTNTPPTTAPPSIPLASINPGDAGAFGVDPRRRREYLKIVQEEAAKR